METPTIELTGFTKRSEVKIQCSDLLANPIESVALIFEFLAALLWGSPFEC